MNDTIIATLTVKEHAEAAVAANPGRRWIRTNPDLTVFTVWQSGTACLCCGDTFDGDGAYCSVACREFDNTPYA
jgi:hypothetical protein